MAYPGHPKTVRTPSVTIYQQDCWGVEQWRAMRDDGLLLFNRHQTDFPLESEAVEAVRSDFYRRQESVIIKVWYRGHDVPKTVQICSY